MKEKIIDAFIARIAEDSQTVVSIDSHYGKKLKRRIEILLNDPELAEIILTKLSDLPNWSGTYSEVLMISFLQECGFPIQLEKKLSGKQTLLGSKSHVSPDIFLGPPYYLYVEVKRFKGVHKEITDNIIAKVKKATGVWEIEASYQHDTFFNNGDHAVSTEIERLKEAVFKGDSHYNSQNYPHLSYAIYHKKVDTSISFHSHEPYRFAREFKYYVLNHANQILKKKSNVLAFVLPPKFNFILTNNFTDDTAFRALARRVFMELTKDNNQLSQISNKWEGNTTKVKSIAKRITAIVFYIDGIDEKDRVYFFINPNVNKSNEEAFGMSQLKMTMDYEVQDAEIFFENFEYDNY